MSNDVAINVKEVDLTHYSPVCVHEMGTLLKTERINHDTMESWIQEQKENDPRYD